VTLPAAPYVHVFVPGGRLEVEGSGVLAAGDSLRLAVADGQRVNAGSDGAEILVWEMHAALV
ncbi:MAG: pirin family protein, partial [Geodermatophilaceae bacterium]|nr:pirin family protein [Geodermatophilaceae bacterium]